MSCAAALTIISGGQTGADRAALDFAIRAGLAHDGWCPRGRLAEDGTLADRYLLRETPTKRYAERTEWNVRDSDATVIFTLAAELSGGTRLTAGAATAIKKPLLHLCRAEIGPHEAAVRLRQFIFEHAVTRLNVAGPRASQEPEIGAYVDAVLSAALGQDIMPSQEASGANEGLR